MFSLWDIAGIFALESLTNPTFHSHLFSEITSESYLYDTEHSRQKCIYYEQSSLIYNSSTILFLGS